MMSPRGPRPLASVWAAALACLAVSAIAAFGRRPDGARAADGDWTAPEWPAGAGNQTDIAMAVDARGRVHWVWTDEDARDGEGSVSPVLDYAVADGEAWAPHPPVPCLPAPAVCGDPAIAIDAAGGIHVVFVVTDPDGASIWHRWRPPTVARWSAPEAVSEVGDGVRRLDPVVAADRVGTLHVAWTDGAVDGPDIRYRQRLLDGTWRPSTLVHEPRDGAQTSASLAVAADGAVHAVWRDDRGGRPGVWTSRLPEHAFVWWPDAALSGPGEPVADRPVVAASRQGVVRAVWRTTDGDGLTGVRGADLTPGGPYWLPSRQVVAADRGPIEALALAAGPDGAFTLAWTEHRPPDLSRVYAARLDVDGTTGARSRIDGTVRMPRARGPVLAVDAVGRATLAWEEPGGGGAGTLAVSRGRMPEPPRERRAVEGFLEVEPVAFGCQSDGWRIVACDGQPVATLLGDDLALARWAGAYLGVEGDWIDAAGCPRLEPDSFGPRTPPCARTSATVYGRVGLGGHAVAGARIHVGNTVALSGASGRFGLTGLPTGRAAITATAPCALSLSAGGVLLQRGQRLDLGDAAFLGGDVVPDGVIDVRDLSRVAWDVRQPSDATSSCSDVDEDGVVSIGDLETVRTRLGLMAPLPWQPTPMPLPMLVPHAPRTDVDATNR